MKRFPLLVTAFLLANALMGCTATVSENTVSDTDDTFPETASDATVARSDTCIHTVLYHDVVLDDSYHSIDGTLIEYVGTDAFDAWVQKKEAEPTGSCTYSHINIVDFVHDFDFPRAVFEELNNNVLSLDYDYNLDAIYGGTAEEYYTNGDTTSDRTQTILEKRVLKLFKSKLIDTAIADERNHITSWDVGSLSASKQDTLTRDCNSTITDFQGNLCQFSIRSFLAAFGIPLDTTETLFQEAKAAYSDYTGELDIYALYSGVGWLIGEDTKIIDIDRQYLLYGDTPTEPADPNNISTVLSPDAGLQERLQAQLSQTNTGTRAAFRDSFYQIPGILANVTDRDKSPLWDEHLEVYYALATDKGEDPYLYNNIYEYIRTAEIPRDTLEELYYASNLYYTHDYDFDLLYGDDLEAVYAYYREDNEEFEKRTTEYQIKKRIQDFVGDEPFADWLQENKTSLYGNVFDTAWSIPEAIYAFDIPRVSMEMLITGETDEIEPVVEEVHEDGTAIVISNAPMYTYDLDLIYSVGSVAELFTKLGVSEDRLGYQVDMLVRVHE